MSFSIVALIWAMFFIMGNHALLVSREQNAYRTGSNYYGQRSVNPKIKCKVIEPQSESSSSSVSSIKQEPIKESTESQKVATSPTCEPPRVLNPITQKCECLFGTKFYPERNQCLCPIDKPIWNGRGCDQCKPGLTQDKKQIQCIQCPEGFVLSEYNGKGYCQPAI